MTKKIAIIGTLDTKGEEIEYIKSSIEMRSHQTIVIDAGILGKPLFEPTITRDQVAQASGIALEEIIAFRNEGKAIARMGAGAAHIIAKLHSNREIDGVIALGATMGTFLGLTALKHLPIGLPKLIVSTIAFSPLISPDEVSGDLMMMQWPGGFWGLNILSKGILDKATEVILGAAYAYMRTEAAKKVTIGVTSLGIRASGYMLHLRPALEEKGYEVIAFHTDGMGGRVFEQAIAEGFINAALDLSAFELSNQLCGGICSAGEHRLEAASKAGIPQVVAPGGIDVFAWPPRKPLPRKFQGRITHLHNPLLMVLTTSVSEQAAVGKLMAQKLNKATGPVAIVIPMHGFTDEDRSGGLWYNPLGHEAFRDALKRNIKREINVVELDAHINEPMFAERVAFLMQNMMEKKYNG